jgi:intein/homing endonuclease
MFAENTDYEILTPSGWKNFRGITTTSDKITFRITLDDGNIVDATSAHYFFVNNKKVKLEHLKVNDCIDTLNGPRCIQGIIENESTTVYDVIEVDDPEHKFVVNKCLITKNCDEFAYVRPTIAKEFWTSISPTLATGGKAIITSTPNSDEDQFAFLWKGANKCEDEYGNPTPLGMNGFKAYRSYWEEHPDRDTAWGDNMRAQLGDDRFRREMNCEFIINDETLIAPAKLLDLQARDPIHRTGQVRWFEPVRKDQVYVVALDPSLGTGGDPAAIQVFEANTTRQVGEWRHNRTPIPEQVRIMADIIKYLHDTVGDDKSIYYSVENNTIGEAALISIQEYGEEYIKGYFLSDTASPTTRRFRKGYNTTNRAKIAACSKLKNLIESGRMRVNSAGLISELKNFVAHGTSYAAKPGETDDLIMATILAVRMLVTLQSYYTELDTQMKDHDSEIIEPYPFISIMM